MTGIPDDLNYAPHYFDKLGNPISMLRWGVLHDDYDYVTVAKDTLVVGGIPLEVSTVWLGINHAFGSSPPVIFETMVFTPAPGELYMDRYCTEEQALAGHAEVMRRLVAKEEELFAKLRSSE